MTIRSVFGAVWWLFVASARPVPKAPAQTIAATASESVAIFMVTPLITSGIARMIGVRATAGIRANLEALSVLLRSAWSR